MGNSLTRVCEEPFRVCEGGDLELGESPLKIKCCDSGQVIRFQTLQVFTSEVMQRRTCIQKLKRMAGGADVPGKTGRPRRKNSGSPMSPKSLGTGVKPVVEGKVIASAMKTEWGTTAAAATDMMSTWGGATPAVWELYPWRDYRFRSKKTWIGRAADSPVVYLFSVCTHLDERVKPRVSEDVADVETAQKYAHKFNMQIGGNAVATENGLQSFALGGQLGGGTGDTARSKGKFNAYDKLEMLASLKGSGPRGSAAATTKTNYGAFPDAGMRVEVIRSLECEVMESGMSVLIQPGDFGILTPLPQAVLQEGGGSGEGMIDKFLFDGREPYCEIAQTFFHYSFFISGGKEIVTDLQGVLTDDALLLIDPVVLRSSAFGSGTYVDGDDLNTIFSTLYPKTTRTAQIFDPHKTAHSRKQVCGISCY
ncbi:unnamed protein product [Amoebophrya sp. A25]|nr:unnamed protein product [Amoebophrya sp. A25]|eukprot:GSA25T00009828001.1